VESFFTPLDWMNLLLTYENRSEFTTEADTLTAFEDFLRASKGSLTASQIAKIRDQVGVVGMAGT
jgi:ubiquitin-like protein 4